MRIQPMSSASLPSLCSGVSGQGNSSQSALFWDVGCTYTRFSVWAPGGAKSPTTPLSPRHQCISAFAGEGRAGLKAERELENGESLEVLPLPAPNGLKASFSQGLSAIKASAKITR